MDHSSCLWLLMGMIPGLFPPRNENGHDPGPQGRTPRPPGPKRSVARSHPVGTDAGTPKGWVYRRAGQKPLLMLYGEIAFRNSLYDHTNEQDNDKHAPY